MWFRKEKVPFDVLCARERYAYAIRVNHLKEPGENPVEVFLADLERLYAAAEEGLGFSIRLGREGEDLTRSGKAYARLAKAKGLFMPTTSRVIGMDDAKEYYSHLSLYPYTKESLYPYTKETDPARLLKEWL